MEVFAMSEWYPGKFIERVMGRGILSQVLSRKKFDYRFERTEEYNVGVDGKLSEDGRWRYFKTLEEALEWVKAQRPKYIPREPEYLTFTRIPKTYTPKEYEKIAVLSEEDMRRLGYVWDEEKHRWVLRS
jgi:hypothetical protein